MTAAHDRTALPMSRAIRDTAAIATRLAIRTLGQLGGANWTHDQRRRDAMSRMIRKGTSSGSSALQQLARRSFSVPTQVPSQPSRVAPRAPSHRFDLTPTEDQQAIAETCREVALEVLGPAAESADLATTTPTEVFEHAAQLSLASLAVPEAFGGLADDHTTTTAVLMVEELARGDAGMAAALLAPYGVAACLARYGNPTQQATYLPAFCADDPAYGQVLIGEPGLLANAMQPTCRGHFEGTDVIINGAKTFSTQALASDLLIVTLTINDEVRLALVDPADPRITSTSEPAMGLRSAALHTISFNNVAVKRRDLLGSADDARDAIRRSRLAWAAASVGVSQAVLDQVIPYVKSRKAFGEPISHRQAVAFEVSTMATEIAAMRLAVWRAAALLDAGKDASAAVATARLLSAKYAPRVGSMGVQLLGGHGFVREYPNERWYRDAQGCAVAEGVLLA